MSIILLLSKLKSPTHSSATLTERIPLSQTRLLLSNKRQLLQGTHKRNFLLSTLTTLILTLRFLVRLASLEADEEGQRYEHDEAANGGESVGKEDGVGLNRGQRVRREDRLEEEPGLCGRHFWLGRAW